MHLPGAAGSGGELGALVAPAWFLVDSALGDAAQTADHGPVQTRRGARELAARRLVHERHELVREPRHGAADADAADVRAPADAVDPPALGDIAVHDPDP